jgi:hypothetical protein
MRKDVRMALPSLLSWTYGRVMQGTCVEGPLRGLDCGE